MNKPTVFDNRHYMGKSEIIHRFNEGTSKEQLIRIVEKRNSVKRREATNIVERALITLFIQGKWGK